MIEFFTKKRGLTLIEHERSKSVRRNESLTLIELLVVFAIMGMLISIVVVSTAPQRERGKDAKRQADIKEITTAMEMCWEDDGQYPNITVDAGRVTNISIVSSVKTYLSPFPQDPNGANYYGEKNAVIPPLTRQQYCMYAISGTLSPTTYFCASEKGVLSSTDPTPPSLGACCY